jgi:hypothetical protein
VPDEGLVDRSLLDRRGDSAGEDGRVRHAGQSVTGR